MSTHADTGAGTDLDPREVAGRVARAALGGARIGVMLILVWIVFQLANDRFLSSVNLSNLLLQITAVGTISVGVSLVLLLGEIDLSVGSVSGLAAGVAAVLDVKVGWPAFAALLAGLATGTVIGAINGGFVTRLRLPSFVVTLAGLIGWQGALLAVLGDTGTVNLPPSVITDLTGTFFAPAIGWVLAIAGAAAYAAVAVAQRVRRSRMDLEPAPLVALVAKVVLVAAALLAATAVLNADRGVPLATVILLALVTVIGVLAQATEFGRHVYAVGGNAEAARRAGIPVTRVRMIVFMLASTFAAAGGILAASRLLAVNQSSGSGDLLLLAIAGPVIAGVSLFGGRGTVWAALLGALVIGSISNGMDLLALESEVKFMITGAVLLAAVSLDAVTRMRRGAAGGP